MQIIVSVRPLRRSYTPSTHGLPTIPVPPTTPHPVRGIGSSSPRYSAAQGVARSSRWISRRRFSVAPCTCSQNGTNWVRPDISTLPKLQDDVASTLFLANVHRFAPCPPTLTHMLGARLPNSGSGWVRTGRPRYFSLMYCTIHGP